MIKKEMVTTAFELTNYTIGKNLGIVRGVSVRSRNLIMNIGGYLQTIRGGNITVFATLCEQTRQAAYDDLIKHAENLGANAIIGFRYDCNEIMQGTTEVLAYGTAVVVDETKIKNKL